MQGLQATLLQTALWWKKEPIKIRSSSHLLTKIKTFYFIFWDRYITWREGMWNAHAIIRAKEKNRLGYVWHIHPSHNNLKIYFPYRICAQLLPENWKSEMKELFKRLQFSAKYSVLTVDQCQSVWNMQVPEPCLFIQKRFNSFLRWCNR